MFLQKYGSLCIVLVLFVASSSYGLNLITNGDFEAGNTGFSTDFIFQTPTPGAASTYAIHTDPSDTGIGSFASFGDHTSGSGNMMVVNGGLGVVWRQTVDVITNTDYDFQAFLANANNINVVTLDFRVNNLSIGTLSAGNTEAQFFEFSATVNSGAASALTIEIIDTVGVSFGDDFVLDDISLEGPAPGAVPELSTMALLFSGFLALFLRSKKY